MTMIDPRPAISGSQAKRCASVGGEVRPDPATAGPQSTDVTPDLDTLDHQAARRIAKPMKVPLPGGEIDPRPTTCPSEPIIGPSVGGESCPDQATVESQPNSVAPDLDTLDHQAASDRAKPILDSLPGGEIDPRPTKDDAKPAADASVGGEALDTQPAAKHAPNSSDSARPAEYRTLNQRVHMIAESLNDAETARIAIGNRIDALERLASDPTMDTRAEEEKAAPKRRKSDTDLVFLESFMPGLGATYASYYRMCDTEAALTKALERAMKAHPLGPWMATARGVGAKQLGRLLASIGDPYWNTKDDRPRRGPAELWAYCGYHVISSGGQFGSEAHMTSAAGGSSSATPTDQAGAEDQTAVVGGVTAKRVKGQRANWSSTAKMRAHLVATSCVKQPSTATYRQVYETARGLEEMKVHQAPCAQCGICDSCGKPPGKNKLDHSETGCLNRKVRHAEPGDPLKDGHKHARAVRKVAKQILLDLYVEAKRWHETST